MKMNFKIRYNSLALLVSFLLCFGLFGQDTLTVRFSTYFGGSGYDVVRDIATDQFGNIYITGGSQNGGIPVTTGAYDQTFNSSGSPLMDAYVAKLDSAGNLIWATYVGGPDYDRAYAIEVDDSGYVYIAGRAGPGFPTTSCAVQQNFAGDNNSNSAYGLQDGFISKLSPDGSALIWSTYVGEGGRGFIRDISIDKHSNVYAVLTDMTQPLQHITSGAFQTTLQGGNDGGVIKISSDGRSVLWCTYVAGNGDEFAGPAIRVDSAGFATIVGTTSSTNIPTTVGAFDTSHNGGGDDIYVAKINQTGTGLVYATFLGGNDYDVTETHSIALTPQGNAVVAAVTGSSNYPVTSGVIQTSYGGNGSLPYGGDACITVLSNDGSTLVASTYFGGSGGDGGEGVMIDKNGDIVFSGYTSSNTLPSNSLSVQQTYGGGGFVGDGIVAKLTADLKSIKYFTYLGKAGEDYFRTICLDNYGNILIGGQSTSNNLNHVKPVQSTFGGATDALLVSLKPTIQRSYVPTKPHALYPFEDPCITTSVFNTLQTDTSFIHLDPLTRKIIINCTDPGSKVIQLYDLFGSEVASFKTELIDFTIPYHTITNGIYFISINTSSRIFASKILVTN